MPKSYYMSIDFGAYSLRSRFLFRARTNRQTDRQWDWTPYPRPASALMTFTCNTMSLITGIHCP